MMIFSTLHRRRADDTFNIDCARVATTTNASMTFLMSTMYLLSRTRRVSTESRALSRTFRALARRRMSAVHALRAARARFATADEIPGLSNPVVSTTDARGYMT